MASLSVQSYDEQSQLSEESEAGQTESEAGHTESEANLPAVLNDVTEELDDSSSSLESTPVAIPRTVETLGSLDSSVSVARPPDEDDDSMMNDNNVANPYSTHTGDPRLSSDNIFKLQRELQELKDEKKMKESQDREFLGDYKMSAHPRGICVIINNTNFYAGRDADERFKEAPLGERLGSDVDAVNLRCVFEKLKFVVKRFDNLTGEEMNNKMLTFAYRTDHFKYDCFVCCILSHGRDRHVYGTDCRAIPIRDLTSHFKGLNCASLREKPKLFFIQACQGDVNQRHFKADSDAPLPATLPDESDFLLGYATLPGYVSYRSETHGSWYITILTETLEKYADKYDLAHIMLKVNQRIATEGSAKIHGGIYKQVPAPMMTLRKRLIFR